MRIAVILAAMLLCACATKPGENVLYYKGVYAPGTVQIAADGAFIARASVWTADNWELAGEAALYRLEESARDKGYTHFLLHGSHKENALGHQYILNGTVYMAQDAPIGAFPIGELRYALERDLGEPVMAAVRPTQPVKAAPAPVVPAQDPVDLMEEELPEGEEPVVIEAPEFITMKPTKRPWG